jgi:hypothetical protein
MITIICPYCRELTEVAPPENKNNLTKTDKCGRCKKTFYTRFSSTFDENPETFRKADIGSLPSNDSRFANIE